MKNGLTNSRLHPPQASIDSRESPTYNCFMVHNEAGLSSKKIIRRLLIGLLILLVIGAAAFVGWAALNSQNATARALEVLQKNHVEREDGQVVFQPDSPTDKGLIFYPGGLVEPEAY